MRYPILPLATLLLFLLAGPALSQSPPSQSSTSPSSTSPSSAQDQSQAPQQDMTAEVEQAIVERTNEFRKEHDLAALRPNEDLNAAAAEFAKFMSETDKYGHTADGRTPAQRAKAAGYEYCVVRENIAYRTNTGEVTAESLSDVFVEGWIESPEHRENMLADFITDTGTAVATDDGVTYFAVQMFGRPKSAMIKLKISNESEETRQLIIEANDSRDEMQMPPRIVLTLSRCFPTTLRLGEDGEPHKLSESTELVITDEGIKPKQ